MDMLYISGLEINTVIGIHDWEQDIEQTLVIDIEIACDITQAAPDGTGMPGCAAGPPKPVGWGAACG